MTSIEINFTKLNQWDSGEQFKTIMTLLFNYKIYVYLSYDKTWQAPRGKPKICVENLDDR